MFINVISGAANQARQNEAKRVAAEYRKMARKELKMNRADAAKEAAELADMIAWCEYEDRINIMLGVLRAIAAGDAVSVSITRKTK